MKILTTIIFFLASYAGFAHEDHYESIKLSNVQIQVCDQYKNSFEIELIRSYADLINNFIKGIDTAEFVYILIDVDYCDSSNDDYHIFFAEFFATRLPDEMPLLYDVELDFLKPNSHLVIDGNPNHFKLKPILKLIEYGLTNKECVLINQRTKLNTYEDQVKKCSETGLPDTIINSNSNTGKVDEEMLYPNKFLFKYKSLEKIGVGITLSEDLIHFINKDSIKLISLSSLYSFQVINDSTIVIFDTNHSIVVIHSDAPSTSKIHTLPLKLSCIEYIKITNTEDSNLIEITIMPTRGYLFEGEQLKKFNFNLLTDKLL